MRKGTAVEVVWKGAEALRPFLVPIESLEPFPGNPRRGDVDELRASLRRWGQTRPILTDGPRIIAGHHVTEAATLEGWTHIAAIPNEFADDDEQLAYLVADNGTSQRGSFDETLLAEKLEALRGRYEGTGYDADAKNELDRRLAELRAAAGEFRRMDEPDFDTAGGPPPALDQRSATTGFFEVPLRYGPDDRKDFARFVAMHKREWAVDDTSAVILRALRESAARL